MPTNTMHTEFGHRSNVGVRGAHGMEFRTRPGISENINPNASMCKQRSPRLGGQALNKSRPSFPAAASRANGTASFGTDITNLAGTGASAGDIEKTMKPHAHFEGHQVAGHRPLKAVVPPKKLPNAHFAAEEVRCDVRKVAHHDIQSVEEYQGCIQATLFHDEKMLMPFPHYMDNQPDLNPKMRMILMDWLIEVHLKYQLRPEVLHLAVNLIDRYLSKVQVMRKKLQLVGVAAMFIASKFEEINPPELHQWVYLTDKAYTKDDVLMMEVDMLNTLGFEIVVPTTAHFLPLLEKANGCSRMHSALTQYIIELGILDIRLLQSSPSHIVSAALLLSNELLLRSQPWPQHMVQQSRHSETSLRTCADLMRQLVDLDRAGDGLQLHAIRKKFSMKDYYSVATMPL